MFRGRLISDSNDAYPKLAKDSSESDREAATSHEELKTLVGRMLDVNQDLCRRLDTLEAGSIVHSCVCSIKIANEGQDDVDTIRPSDEKDNAQDLDSPESYQFRFAFESILEASRVYRKAEPNECDMCSLKGSVARSHAWSSLSDLSLAQISVISVIALPLYPSGISNSEWYTFGDITEVDIPSSDQPKPDTTPGHSVTTSEESSTLAGPPDKSEPDTSALGKIETGTGDGSTGDEDSYPCKGCGEVLEEGKAYELGSVSLTCQFRHQLTPQQLVTGGILTASVVIPALPYSIPTPIYCYLEREALFVTVAHPIALYAERRLRTLQFLSATSLIVQNASSVGTASARLKT